MSLGTILFIVLIIILIGGIAPFGGNEPAHFYGTGYIGGGVGLVLMIVLILVLLGRL